MTVAVLCIFYGYVNHYKKTSIFTSKPDDVYGLPDVNLQSVTWKSAKNEMGVPLKSGVAIVLYISTECPIARKYRPELLRIEKEVHGKAVSWWYVFPPEDKATAYTNFRASQLIGTPVFEPGYGLAKQCSVRVTPTALVFDSAGKLRYRGRVDDRSTVMGEWKPKATRRDLYLAIKEVVAEKPVSRPQTDANGCFLPFVVEN